MARNGTRPFWLHQLVEYILGITLVSQALQSPTPAVPAIAGAVMLVNAAIVRGPLAAFRLVGRRTHRLADLGVIGLTVLLAVQPWVAIDAGARLIMVFIAAVQGFVWWQSDLAEPAPRAPRAAGTRSPVPSAPSPSPSPSPSPPVSPSPSSGAGSDRSTQVGRAAGRAVGSGVRAVRRWTKQ